MIRALRKKHLEIWIVLSILIPVGMICAILVRPVFPKDKLLQPDSSQALPILMRSLIRDPYTFNIRSSLDTSQLQLEWIIREKLIYPTATIYEDTANFNDISKAVLLGRIEIMGTYHFQLANRAENTYHFIIYDFVHKQIIESVNI